MIMVINVIFMFITFSIAHIHFFVFILQVGFLLQAASQIWAQLQAVNCALVSGRDGDDDVDDGDLDLVVPDQNDGFRCIEDNSVENRFGGRHH